jgi:hypothetical protein
MGIDSQLCGGHDILSESWRTNKATGGDSAQVLCPKNQGRQRYHPQSKVKAQESGA